MIVSLAGAGARRFLLMALLAALAGPVGAGDVARAFEFGGSPKIQQTAGGYAVQDEQCFDPNVMMAQCQSCPMGGQSCPMGGCDQGMCGDPCMGCGEDVCCCDPCCMPCCPPPAKRSFVFGEFLMLRPTDGDVAHAQHQDGLGGAGTVPFGTIGTADIEYAPGFRVGGGWCVGPCSAITASYTWFESSDASELGLPNFGGGAVGSLVQHPGAALTASTGPVAATYNIDFQLADVMFRDVLVTKTWCELNYSVGGVYGNIDQDFSQTGAFGGGGAGAKQTRTNVEFHGGGIKAGLDGERFLARGLRVYGKLNGSLMSGRFNTSYRLQNVSTTADLAIAEWKDNRAISLVECELGIAKVCCNDRLRLSAGYLFQQWGNMVTTSDFIQGVRQDNYNDLSDSLRFDGFTVRAEARW